jgi:hypothetical protein
MKSADEFVEAPMYTVFQGPVELDDQELLTDEEWDLFSVSGDQADANVRREANRRGIMLAHNIEGDIINPQKDDVLGPEKADDLDAALSYIASGGMLVKLPDTPDSQYWRLYAVLLYKPRHGLTEPAPPPLADVQPSSQN